MRPDKPERRSRPGHYDSSRTVSDDSSRPCPLQLDPHRSADAIDSLREARDALINRALDCGGVIGHAIARCTHRANIYRLQRGWQDRE